MILSRQKKKKSSLDLALVMCPAWGINQPPTSISYLKGFLKTFGIKVKCIDLNLELYKVFPKKEYWNLNFPEHFTMQKFFENDILPFLESFFDTWAETLLSCNPRAIGLSLYASNIHMSINLAGYLKKKKPDLIILAGGPEVTRIKKHFLNNYYIERGFHSINRDITSGDLFDLLIEGEGEEALLEILSLIKRNKDFHSVNGTLYFKQGNLVVNKPREMLQNLDILPPADYNDFQLKSYAKEELPLLTSRGCINHCTFCADTSLWKMYRYKSPQKVVEEIRFLIRNYRRSELEIVDSSFNGSILRVEKICDLIIKYRLRIKWSAKTSLKKEMSYDLLRKMEKSGCCSLAYGVESGSSRVLKDMRKHTDLQEAKRIIRDTHRAGIQPNCFFIVGYPTETEEDFQLTLNFIRENAAFIGRFDQVTGCHIEEDSYLGLNLDKYGIIFKEDGWHNKEVTPQIRENRLARFRDLARELHKHYRCEVQL